MSTAKSNEAWEVFQSTLTAPTRAALVRAGSNPLPVETVPETGEDDETMSYRMFVKGLTPQTQAALAAPRPEAVDQPHVEQDVAKWGIVESPDGEWAQLRLFKSAEGLARRLQQLEGTDTVVWCFFGVPVPVTKGPQRLIALPGGKRAMQVPLYEGGPCPIVEVDGDELTYEKMGYVGPPELAEAPPSKESLEAQAAVSGDDDDDD